jgi:DNA-binding beta-propeller fold protein YncE
MSLKLTCPACAAIFGLTDDARGKKAFCPKCGAPLIVTSGGVAKRNERPADEDFSLDAEDAAVRAGAGKGGEPRRPVPARPKPAPRWNPLWLLLALPLLLLCLLPCGFAAYLAVAPHGHTDEPKQVAKNDDGPPPAAIAKSPANEWHGRSRSEPEKLEPKKVDEPEPKKEKEKPGPSLVLPATEEKVKPPPQLGAELRIPPAKGIDVKPPPDKGTEVKILPKKQPVKYSKAYYADFAGKSIIVVDTASCKVIRRVEVGPNPHGLVATAAADLMFITVENVNGKQGELLWYDTATETVTNRLKVGPRPHQPACTPDGKFVYVPCNDASWWVVDAEKAVVVKKIATGGRPHNTLCSGDGQFMYLGPIGPKHHVLIAEVTSHTLAGEIPFSNSPGPIVLSEDGKRLYANVDKLIGFEVADVPNRKLLHRVQADPAMPSPRGDLVPADVLRRPSQSHGIGLRPGEKELWMCDLFHDRTYVFDLTVSPPKQVASIPMKGGGYWMSFTPDGRFCFISERIGAVAVVDTELRLVMARNGVALVEMPKQVLVLAPTAR